ncbi:MAG: NAD-dependent deacylase [Pseudomonadota bacterium]
MADKIVILTGAGLSAESGLGTFRDKGGLWDKFPLEEVATPEGFAANPTRVHDFYNLRRGLCMDAAPNAAHAALAELEARWAGEVVTITQNVDDLHERAGSHAVIHMHGELLQALCGACGHRWEAPREMSTLTECPACGAVAARPDVVWFGEIPYQMDEIFTHLEEADLFVAIGTSGTVYPAAGFVAEVRARGCATLEINLEPSDVAAAFDDQRQGKATDAVPAWVSEMLARP